MSKSAAVGGSAGTRCSVIIGRGRVLRKEPERGTELVFSRKTAINPVSFVSFFVFKAKIDVLDYNLGVVGDGCWAFSVNRVCLLLRTRRISARGDGFNVPNELA